MGILLEDYKEFCNLPGLKGRANLKRSDKRSLPGLKGRANLKRSDKRPLSGLKGRANLKRSDNELNRSTAACFFFKYCSI